MRGRHNKYIENSVNICLRVPKSQKEKVKEGVNKMLEPFLLKKDE